MFHNKSFNTLDVKVQHIQARCYIILHPGFNTLDVKVQREQGSGKTTAVVFQYIRC